MVLIVRVLMGVIKDRHGTYYARKTVPAKPTGLRAAVALELGTDKPAQSHLKRSLGTKDVRDANVRAKPVLAEFDRIIAKAKARLVATTAPLRTSLSDTEIKRITEYFYAYELGADEDLRTEGIGDDPLFASIHQQLSEAGIEFESPFSVEKNGSGLSNRMMHKIEEGAWIVLPALKAALARGNVDFIRYELNELLQVFQINLDPNCLDYRKLALAVMRAWVRALEAIQARHRGEPIETPPLNLPDTVVTTADGGKLKDALEGWKKHRARPKGTVNETSRAVDMFIQLHGNMAVAAIKKRHALEYRNALQEVPRHRTGSLLGATLPEQAAWGREHPEAPRLTAATINKQLGCVQAICVWASDNGLIPDDVQWADPFSRLRLPTERSERTSFEVAELQSLFNAPLFTEHRFPLGAHGAAGFWLPVLALHTGARLAELGHLTADNVKADAKTGVALLYFETEKARGKRTKTDASERVVSVHPEVIRLGFLDYVEARRSADGADAWLFPSLSPDNGSAGVPAWSKWFGRYLRDEGGVTDKAKVFHSFRHTVKDALRRGAR